MNDGNRLAEVMGAISLATDMARGQALESAMGTTVLATRIARRMGLGIEPVAETYYTAVARTLGCTSAAMEVAPLVLGEDRTFAYAMHLCDLADKGSVRAELERHFATDRPAEERARAIETVLDHHAQLPAMAASTGHQAVALTRRLPLPKSVPGLLAHLDARWDGKNPLKAAGEDIPLVARIVELAVVAELFRRAGGPAAVLELATSRSGGQFDPAVCATVRSDIADLLEGLDAPSLWHLYIETEPDPVRLLTADDLQALAEVAADYADNKSGWLVGHSRVVATLAHSAARRLGLEETDQTAALLAGLMHDLGRCAISNGVWDKSGPLSERELWIAQTHSEHTEKILASCSALRPWASVASAAHERCDGSGYHHHHRRRDMVSELIAAADVYVALVHDRPWRDAFSETKAAELLEQEAHAGRLAPAAVHAILEARGHRKAPGDAAYPDGLTKREVEVLVLLARGLPTKQIASKLGVAFKTTDNHIQNLYRKIGATSRAAAAMYAVERGIYSP